MFSEKAHSYEISSKDGTVSRRPVEALSVLANCWCSASVSWRLPAPWHRRQHLSGPFPCRASISGDALV